MNVPPVPKHLVHLWLPAPCKKCVAFIRKVALFINIDPRGIVNIPSDRKMIVHDPQHFGCLIKKESPYCSRCGLHREHAISVVRAHYTRIYPELVLPKLYTAPYSDGLIYEIEQKSKAFWENASTHKDSQSLRTHDNSA